MITWHGTLVFLHVAAAIGWVGVGFAMMMLAIPAFRSNDPDRIVGLMRQLHQMESRIVPIPPVLLLTGVALVIFYGDWGELWIILGLVGIAATALTGMFILSPRTKKVVEIAHRDGATHEAVARSRDFLKIARFDVTVLFVIVADMVLKPRSDDIVTVLVLAAILVAAAVLFLGGSLLGTRPQSEH